MMREKVAESLGEIMLIGVDVDTYLNLRTILDSIENDTSQEATRIESIIHEMAKLIKISNKLASQRK